MGGGGGPSHYVYCEYPPGHERLYQQIFQAHLLLFWGKNQCQSRTSLPCRHFLVCKHSITKTVFILPSWMHDRKKVLIFPCPPSSSFVSLSTPPLGSLLTYYSPLHAYVHSFRGCHVPIEKEVESVLSSR